MGIFRYEISSAGVETLSMADAPEGWKDDESIFPRSKKHRGIFRKYSANILVFHGDGAEKLREIFNFNKFESQGTYKVYEQELQGYSGEFLRFEGSFDFIKYKDIENNENGNSVEINVIDSAFWNTIKNRALQKPRLNSLEGMDGLQLTGFTNEETFATLPSSLEQFFGMSSTLYVSPTKTGHHSVPALATGNDINVVDVADPDVIDGIGGAFYIVSDLIFTIGVTFNFSFNAKVEALSGAGQVQVILTRYDSGGTSISREVLKQVSVNSGLPYPSYFNFAESRDFIPNTGDFFLLTIEGLSFFQDFEVSDPYISVTNTNTASEVVEAIQVSGMLLHEAMARLLQIISNTDNPLYSELLGRTDSEPRSYAENGQLSEMLITNGELIRGFENDVSPVTIGFDELFSSLNAIAPIGIGIEKINGIDTIRLEGAKYFYDNRVVLQIEDPSNVILSVNKDLITAKISAGYSKAVYEEKDGRFEYNQKTTYGTPISVVSNEYAIVSTVRADDQGIRNAALKDSDNFPTEDTKYDKDNFFLTLIINESYLLNGKFDDWINDNTPNNWTVSNELGVLRKNLLGSDRCYFMSGSGSINQSAIFSKIDRLTLKFNYANIGDLPVDIAYSVRLIGGSSTYALSAAGAWIETTNLVKNYIERENPVDENELQSFKSKSLLTGITPEFGTLQVVFYSAAGFIIDDIYVGEQQFVAKTNQGYDNISGAINGNSSLNLDITPARNLRNHGPNIRAGLENNLGKYIRFNSSDKNSDLSTRKSTEAVSIDEDADILIADLAPPYFTPDKWEAAITVDKSVIDVLNATFDGETKPKYLGIVKIRNKKLGKYIYLWIDDVSTGGQSGIGSIVGREVNLDYVIPIEL